MVRPLSAGTSVANAHTAGATHTVGMSREASYVLSIATVNNVAWCSPRASLMIVQEDFIKRLVLGAYEEAQGERRNVINYHDVGAYFRRMLQRCIPSCPSAATTQQYQELFLQGTTRALLRLSTTPNLSSHLIPIQRRSPNPWPSPTRSAPASNARRSS